MMTMMWVLLLPVGGGGGQWPARLVLTGGVFAWGYFAKNKQMTDMWDLLSKTQSQGNLEQQ